MDENHHGHACTDSLEETIHGSNSPKPKYISYSLPTNCTFFFLRKRKTDSNENVTAIKLHTSWVAIND